MISDVNNVRSFLRVRDVLEMINSLLYGKNLFCILFVVINLSVV